MVKFCTCQSTFRRELFVDCSGSADPQLRDLSEQSGELVRRQLQRVSTVLMYMRFSDFFVNSSLTWLLRGTDCRRKSRTPPSGLIFSDRLPEAVTISRATRRSSFAMRPASSFAFGAYVSQ